MAWPMPRVPPVTNAVLPSRLKKDITDAAMLKQITVMLNSRRVQHGTVVGYETLQPMQTPTWPLAGQDQMPTAAPHQRAGAVYCLSNDRRAAVDLSLISGHGALLAC